MNTRIRFFVAILSLLGILAATASVAAAMEGTPLAPTSLRANSARTVLSWDQPSNGVDVRGWNVYANNSYVTTVTNSPTYSMPAGSRSGTTYYIVAFDTRETPNFSARSAEYQVPGATTPTPTPTPTAGVPLSPTNFQPDPSYPDRTLTWEQPRTAGVNVYSWELQRNGVVVESAMRGRRYNIPVSDRSGGNYSLRAFTADGIGSDPVTLAFGSATPTPTSTPTPGGSFAPVRNPEAEAGGDFERYSNVANLSDSQVIELTEPFDENDGGRLVTALQSGGLPGEGNFRVSCQYSHFAKDDSIVKPGESGAAHLHMFFGNTSADANTDVVGNIEDSGGGSCNGYALNRSAYWVPALLDGNRNALLPYQIIAYYKTKKVDVEGGIQPMAQGLKMIAGNPTSGSFSLNSVKERSNVFWSCGASGSRGNWEVQIPTHCSDPARNVNLPDNPDDPQTNFSDPTDINATIRFPQCVRPGQLTSPDPQNPTHTARLDDGRNEDCPDDMIRIPELSVLLYWKAPANPAEVANWRLSSDTTTPGGSLHADWIGGWKDSIMQEFIDNCLTNVTIGDADATGMNCGLGNHGTVRDDIENGRQLDIINPDQWQGPFRVRASDLPS